MHAGQPSHSAFVRPGEQCVAALTRLCHSRPSWQSRPLSHVFHVASGGEGYLMCLIVTRR